MFKKYSNKRAIAKAEKKLEKLENKKRPDEFAIAMATENLKNEKLFEEYSTLYYTWGEGNFSYIWL